ncbi:hypothetical protein SPBR_09074 [Sporothrix brasiliensis 5110]|uniref:Ctl transporter n=1 Tax=Sporothrix brasiliensis 5110 TaxID=1398154 RepID=A0A0C2J3A6_9PEZI|nr:uncharacterized protein SPBR_09074 [Sporothrix brasiliensis 5110]KIH91542.1 hypothetical protein SPBR_09074 [Sporothrix brasiliensis 5110]
MFSEYASRFLAQSQSRLSNFGQAAGDDTGSNTGGDTSNRQAGDWPSRNNRSYGRSFLGRGFGGGGGGGTGASGNPYQSSGSRFGQLNFASRYSTAAQDAPLFHEVEEEEEGVDDDDEVERDREAADLYALQRSRRVFAASRLEESTGTDNELSNASLRDSKDDDGRHRLSNSGRRTRAAATSNAQDGDDAFMSNKTKGVRESRIQSSWNENRTFHRPGRDATANEEDSGGYNPDLQESRGKMVDIGLESTIAESEPPLDLTVEAPREDDDNPVPAFQKFAAAKGSGRFGFRRGSTNESELGLLRDGAGGGADSEANFGPGDPVSSSVLQQAVTGGAPSSDMELFRHDPFFAWIYLIALASLFATFVLVYLHTSGPTGGEKQPWGDTIYTTLLSSIHLLAVDTLVAVIVSLVWLAALRSFARYMVGLIIVAVPVILIAFSIYPLVSSYQGAKTGSSGFQDTVMRWASIVPGVSAVVWLYLVWKGRSALRSSIDILEFSSRILAANSALVLVGMGCLMLIVFWTWAWLAMFTRVFLGGSFSSKLSRFIISTSSWWLGVYFVLMYIWTLSVISGVQRATTGATVSQWYFHRNVQPAPSSNEVVSAALHHAMTTIFGSICLSTLLALAVRLPLLVLPVRLANGLGLFFYSFIPTPIAALTNPLTLTYGAIHSQNLTAASQGLTQLAFLSPEAPTTTLTPRMFQARQRRKRYGGVGSTAPLLPYRLAKLLLHATRFIMATALGFAGWVITARQLRVALPDGAGGSVRGSAYAYVVGLVASFIGWGVLGAMEGILSGIVDAVVICYGSETRMSNNAGVGAGGGGYCMEAAYLFGGRGDGGVEEDDFHRTNREVY